MWFNFIKEKHCGGLARHFGIDKTLSLVKDKYYWPQMYKDIQKFVKSCGVCQVGKGVRILVCVHVFLFLGNPRVTSV